MSIEPVAPDETPGLAVEPTGQSGGICDCCGGESRTVWGWVHEGDATVAAYFVHWTPGASLDQHAANIDLIIGSWGADEYVDERVAVSAIHFVQDGRPGAMLIDATDRPSFAETKLARRVMRRADVLNTPLAGVTFALIDAVLVGDPRLR